MREAFLQQDADRVRHAAHSLKSASANVGAMILSDQAKTLEADARQGVIEWNVERVDEMEAEYRQVCDALQAYKEIMRHE